jgi:hypothetical protein
VSDINFQFTSDEKDVIRGQEAMRKQYGKLRDQISDLATMSKQAGEQDSRLAKERLASLKQLVERQQELKRETERLQAEMKAGNITADEYRKAFDGIGKETDQLNTQLRRLNAQVNEDTRDLKRAADLNAKYETSTERVGRSIKELNRLREKGFISAQQHARGIAAEKRTLDEGRGAAASFTREVAQMAGGWLTANAAMSAGSRIVATLRREYERMLEAQGKAAGAHLGLAAAQEQAAFNLGDDPTLTIETLFSEVKKTASELGMNEADLTAAVSDALSARGDANAGQALRSVQAAAKLRRFAPEELPGLSASALDISKGTGLDLEQSLGFLLMTGTQSRVTNMKDLSENIAPAIVGGMQMGARMDTSAALVAALSQGGVDPTGRTSRTGQTALLAQAREFGRATSGFFQQDQSAEQVIQIMLQNPAVAEQFLGSKKLGGFGATFEKKMAPAVEALFTPGTAVNRQFFNARGEFGKDPQVRYDQTVQQIGQLESVQVARLKQNLDAQTNQLQLSNLRGAAGAVIREGLAEVEQAVGQSGLRSDFDTLMRDFAGGGAPTLDAADQALGVLESKLRGRKVRNRTWTDTLLSTQSVSVAGGGTIATAQPTREANQQEIEQAETIAVLREQLKQLEGLNLAIQNDRQAGNVAARGRQNEQAAQ